MNNLPLHLKQDYQRFKSQIPKKDDFTRPFLGYDDILIAHYLICDYFETNYQQTSIYGVRDLTLLGSAIGRQKTSFGGCVKWKTLYEYCATLFFGLVKNHPFHDGNKRTALLALLYQLQQSKRVPDASQKEFETLTVRVAESGLEKYSNYNSFCKPGLKKEDSAVYFIADFLRKKTRILNSSYKPLTFFEFNAILKQYDCFMDNPSGNYINVYKTITKRCFIFKKTFSSRVLQIGFPGWRKQINQKAFKETLKALDLTPDRGFDRKVFFENAEPLYKLIYDFEGPLRRLKDK